MIEKAEAAFEHHNPETFECSSKIFREVNRIATITFCQSPHRQLSNRHIVAETEDASSQSL